MEVEVIHDGSAYTATVKVTTKRICVTIPDPDINIPNVNIPGYAPDGSVNTANSLEDDTSTDEEKNKEECDAISKEKPDNCGDKPPSVAANGCSTGGAFSYESNYFSSSCNKHDNCYSTLGAVKSACDTNFSTNMHIQCGEIAKTANNNNYQNIGSAIAACTNSADAFYLAVTIPGISTSLFNGAQADRICYNWHKKKEAAECND